MKSIKTLCASTIAVAALLSMSAVQAASITKDEYKAGKDRIEAQHKADKALCDPMSGNAKDICQEEAKAKEKVAKAELEYSYTGKDKDLAKIGEVKADTSYEVAKERCDDKSGDAKDLCQKEAKATHTKALAEAKLGKKVSDARSDAADDIRDADYKVAVERCQAMSGDAKSSCITSAKAKFGKS